MGIWPLLVRSNRNIAFLLLEHGFATGDGSARHSRNAIYPTLNDLSLGRRLDSESWENICG